MAKVTRVDLEKIEKIRLEIISKINDWFYGSPGDLTTNSQFVNLIIYGNNIYIDIDTTIIHDSASDSYVNYDECRERLGIEKTEDEMDDDELEKFINTCKAITREEFLKGIEEILYANGFEFKDYVYDPHTKSYWLRYEYML